MHFQTTITARSALAYRRAGHWADRVLLDYVTGHAATDPNKPAVIEEERTLSYERLLQSVDSAACALLDLGVSRGSVVSVQLPNWSEFAVIMLALERIGAIINPLTPILRENELGTILRLAHSQILFVPDKYRGFSHADMAVALKTGLPHLEHVVAVRGRARPGVFRWEDLVENAPPHVKDLEPAQSGADDIIELAFTSGTTGEPKGVLHTHNTALATVGSTIKRQSLTPNDVFHVATPVGHNAGYFYGLRIALQSGGTAVLQPTWNPEEMGNLVEAHSVTFTMGATTFLIDFLDSGRIEQRDLASLRVVTCGGAPIPEAVAKEFERRLPGRLCPVFGMTEMGHSTATDATSPRTKALTTDGSPQPEMQMKIVDDEDQPLPSLRQGHLKFRGPFLFAGYVQGLDFTRTQFDDEGFFDTGDLAYHDEDGYIRITGRAKDLIIRGGENIPVREVEEVLAAHPKVAEGVVVGVPDERLGEKAVACVRIKDGCAPVTLEELRNHFASARVTKQFWPEDVINLDHLPMTAAGKTQKAELRKILIRERTKTRESEV